MLCYYRVNQLIYIHYLLLLLFILGCSIFECVTTDNVLLGQTQLYWYKNKKDCVLQEEIVITIRHYYYYTANNTQTVFYYLLLLLLLLLVYLAVYFVIRATPSYAIWAWLKASNHVVTTMADNAFSINRDYAEHYEKRKKAEELSNR